MDQLAKEYGDANGVAISVQVQGNYDQMVQKIQAGIAANSLPHLAILGQRHGIPQMADSQRLIPVADLIKADSSFNEGDFLAAFSKKFTYKGQLQTVPFISSSPVMHYNRTAFKAANLDPDRPPATWNELVTAAKALTRRDGSTLAQRGLDTGEDTAWYAYGLIWQNGGQLLAEDGQSAFNQAPGVGALQFWKDLVHTHRVMAPPAAQGRREGLHRRQGRDVLPLLIPNRRLERQIGDKFEYGNARFPGHKERAVPVGGASLGIFRSDPAHDATAWNFVKFLTSAETNARLSRETGYVANRASTLQLPDMRDYLAKNPRRAIAIQQLREDIRAENINPADAVIWLGLEKAQEQLEADPNADPKRLLDDLAAETTKYLKEY